MKKILFLVLALSLNCCSCGEDEDFGPYPGGKIDQKKETPR